MGTGGRAAIDSTMTVELFARLIRAGVSPDSALNITNSALSVKSDDESLSTLDVAEIDLFDGNTTIYKAGAAPSFYTFSGKVRTAEIPSTPLGILSKVTFSRYALKLRGGDTLVMVSDGILGCGNNWVKDEIKGFSGGVDASAFSQDIVDSARRRCGNRFDDMTVITAVAEEI
jgi:stage II sporulation protein E